MNICAHCESKKLCHLIFIHNFDKSQTLSLLHSAVNMQETRHIFQQTLDVSLHCLMKYNRSNLAFNKLTPLRS